MACVRASVRACVCPCVCVRINIINMSFTFLQMYYCHKSQTCQPLCIKQRKTHYFLPYPDPFGILTQRDEIKTRIFRCRFCDDDIKYLMVNSGTAEKANRRSTDATAV